MRQILDDSTINKELYPQYKQREEDLKKLLKICDNQISENKKNIGEKFANRNIEVLKRIRSEINGFKTKKFINQYVLSNNELKGFSKLAASRQIGLDLILTIANYSVPTNMVHDIVWIDDIKVPDMINVALGKELPNIFKGYIPNLLKEMKESVIPFFTNTPQLETQANLLKRTILLAKEEEYLASNIILFTVNESLARHIAHFVYKKQYPEISNLECDNFIFNTHNSLESLLVDSKWKRDFEINWAEAIYSYTNTEDKEILKFQNEFYTKDKSKSSITNKMSGNELLNIPIGIRLGFFCRSYKNDRNSIIHGSFDKINHNWKNYIYFSVTKELKKVFEYYISKYKI